MQLLNPRETYTFENFLDPAKEDIDLYDMTSYIQNMLMEEFNITCDLEHASEIFDCEIEAHNDYLLSAEKKMENLL